MTKKKMNELVLAACEEHKASPELTSILNELTAPKVGGSSDVNDYTVFDGEDVTHVFCNLHKKWEPVAIEIDGEVVELFRRDEKSKNGFYRDCNEGIRQFRDLDKAIKASKAAIMQDVLDEVISGSEAKTAIEGLGDVRSSIEPREDGLGEDEKPGNSEV